MSWKYNYIEIPLYVENKHSLRRNKKSLVVQIIKNFPAIQETWVQFLSVEDPLEEDPGQSNPVFLPGESHGQRSLAATDHGDAKSWT